MTDDVKKETHGIGLPWVSGEKNTDGKSAADSSAGCFGWLLIHGFVRIRAGGCRPALSSVHFGARGVAVLRTPR